MLQQSTFGHDFGVGPRLTFPTIRGDADTATEAVVDGVRVNIITHIPSCKDFGSPLKKWSRIGVEGASYIYSFEQKCLCLKVKYASPLIEKARSSNWIPLPILGKYRRPRVGQYFSHNSTSMCVVRYDDSAFVYALPSNHIAVVNLIYIETILSLMSCS
jgi:hypothetical protein